MLWDPNKDKKMVDEIGECYLKAIEVIEQRGWCQGRLMDNQGKLCIVGAIQMTNAPYNTKNYALRLLHRTLGLAGHWNDAPERTKGEVIAKLKEIAYAKRP